MVYFVSEGPYRDLGSGFARLSGAEAPRRAPSFISSVEDALLELLRNSRDAGAKNIFVATTLRSRRYREITVIDDGCGVPESHAEIIFEPGVTTRHLVPIHDGAPSAHGAGLALHHIKNAAVEAELRHPSSPTSMKVVFDTEKIPERSLQSETRASQSNLLATTSDFARENPAISLYHATPATILATLLNNHIIPRIDEKAGRVGLASVASGVGLDISVKTAGRVLRGEVCMVGRVAVREPGRGEYGSGVEDEGFGRRSEGVEGIGGPSFFVGETERGEVEAALRRAAAASYLELGAVKFEARPGGVVITAKVHEPEDEYG